MSSQVQFPSPYYCRKNTIEYHDKNLRALLDLNFGKDWSVFLQLFYSEKFTRHSFQYNNPHPVERQKFKKSYSGEIVRKAIFRLSTSIMNIYLNLGFEETKKVILEDKLRFKWSFKGQKYPAEIVVSDELYEAKKAYIAKPKPELEFKEKILAKFCPPLEQ